MTFAPTGLHVFIIIFAVLFLVYLPTMTGYYLQHDDWTVFDWNHHFFLGHNIAPYLLNECGRPLGAVVLVCLTRFIKTISDANVVRFVLVVLLSFCAFLFYHLVRGIAAGNRVRRLEVIAFTVFTFSLVPFLSYVGYLSNGLDIVGMLFAIPAIMFAFRAYRNPQGKPLLSNSLLSIFFSLLCLTTYQPMAFIFWSFLAFEILQWDMATLKERLRHPRALLCLLGNFFLPFGLYGIYILLWKKYVSLTVSMDFPTEPWLDKALWFFQDPMVNSLNLWRLFPTNDFAWSVICLMVAGFLAEILVRIRRQESPTSVLSLVLTKILIIPPFLLGSEFPILMARARYSAYRAHVGDYLLVALVLFYTIRHLSSLLGPGRGKKFFRYALVLASLVSFYHANYNLTNYVVFSNSVEVRFIKSRLRQVDLSQYKRIFIIRPDYSCLSLVAPDGRYDEFGRPGSRAFQDVYSMVQAIMIDIGIKIKEQHRDLKGMVVNKRWIVSHGTWEEYQQYPEPTLLIDMNRLQYFY